MPPGGASHAPTVQTGESACPSTGGERGPRRDGGHGVERWTNGKCDHGGGAWARGLGEIPGISGASVSFADFALSPRVGACPATRRCTRDITPRPKNANAGLVREQGRHRIHACGG
jgi:hypothetical protein